MTITKSNAPTNSAQYAQSAATGPPTNVATASSRHGPGGLAGSPYPSLCATRSAKGRARKNPRTSPKLTTAAKRAATANVALCASTRR